MADFHFEPEADSELYGQPNFQITIAEGESANTPILVLHHGPDGSGECRRLADELGKLGVSANIDFCSPCG